MKYLAGICLRDKTQLDHNPVSGRMSHAIPRGGCRSAGLEKNKSQSRAAGIAQPGELDEIASGGRGEFMQGSPPFPARGLGTELGRFEI